MPNNFTYTNDIPDTNNNPSTDQPNMKINTNSIDSLLDIDHVSFNDNNGGIHKQVRMRNQGNPGLGDGQGALYCDNVNGDGIAWPVWANATGGLAQYEIISFPARLPAMPTPTYGVVPVAGKMILQFGTFTTTTNGNGNANEVNFFSAFPNAVYNIQLTPQLSTFAQGQSWGATTNDLTKFNLYTSSGVPVGTVFFWTAIGS